MGGCLSGGAARRQDELQHPRCGRPAKETSRCQGCLPCVPPGSPSQPLSLFRSAREEMFFLSGSGLLKISVLWSPAGPLLLLASALRSEAGSQSAHGLGRPFPASSRVVCLLLRHSGGPSGRRCGHPDGVTGRALAGGLRRRGGSSRAREAGCAGEGAPGRAHHAGLGELGAGRLQHHGQVARWLLPASQAASPRGVMPPSPVPSSSWSVHPATFRPASPAAPPPHFIWLPGSPGNVLPGSCWYPEKQLPRPFNNIRPLLLTPEPRHSSTPSALPNWGQPLSDCSIFFAAHPGAEVPARSAACRESHPSLGVPRSGSRRGGRRGEWGEGGGGRLGRSASPPGLLL